MTAYEKANSQLVARQMVWLITGVVGFIGSNLAEYLLKLVNQVYNVGVDASTTLNQLLLLLCEFLQPSYPHLERFTPTYGSFRVGDVRESRADIGKAARFLGYEPAYTVRTGLEAALELYRQNL